VYYSFFGLSHPPFKITPDTDVFFEGGNRGAILEALIYAISEGEGIIKVTGEVGSGKTMLCRMLQARLPAKVETVYLANPRVSPEEILHAIAFELQFGLPKSASRLEVMHRLNEYLLERHAQQKQVVLFVEESQSMSLATLEEIRLLSNLETKQHKLLQIVLFGQPELDENLRLPQIRQLRERITHSFPLSPLRSEDVRAYLHFRLHAAGYRGPDLFNRRVVDYIAKASEGLTRRINIIADKALLAAFAEGTHNVSLKHAKAAVQDSEFSATSAARARSPVLYALAGLVAGGALGFAIFAGFQWDQRAKVDSMPSAGATAAPASQAAPTIPQPPEPVSHPAPQASPTTSQSPEPVSRDPAEGQRSFGASTYGNDAQAATPEPDADPLELRLQATEHWLAQMPGNQYSIQLLGSPDAEFLRSYFNTIGNYLDIENVFVYRTVAKNRPSLTVLYGSFRTRKEATEQIDRLPEELKVNRPYYRTIRGIRAEIALHSRS